MNVLPSAALAYPWWPTMGAPLADHLWQSSLFATAAGLLTVLLKRNHARTRYWIWLLASAKFLIPSFLLVAIGTRVGSSRILGTTPPTIVLTVQSIIQPFASVKPSHAAVPAATALALATQALPTVLLAIWCCGFVAVLLYWWLRSRRMTAAIRGAQPVKSGRELGVLRRLERDAGRTHHLDLIVSESTMEPGILGILHPVLVLPLDICDRLSDSQAEAVLTHELCHVRHRDNLAAATHMLVEALFWYYPLVWWLGGRLVDEREHACDEEVLRLGTDPQTYAESILKICEFYLESPIFCTAGVTGSNLQKRIEAIMLHRAPLNLNLARKLLLTSAGFMAVAVPLVFGVLHATQTRAQSQTSNTSLLPVFKSVSVEQDKSGKPGETILYENDGISAANFRLLGLVSEAYRVQESQIQGPDWLKSERYDVEAKVDGSVAGETRTFNIDLGRLMLRPLLADHFYLVVHRETRVVPVYALIVADTGSQLRESPPGSSSPGRMRTLSIQGKGRLAGNDVPLSGLVDYFARQLDRPVLDETGLTGQYDFTLQWTPDAPSGSLVPSLSTALDQQLGLKLEQRVSPVEFLVIDNVNKPSQN